jgi:uncharacterized protein (DUF1015 family)
MGELMADIIPFRALRYDPRPVPDLAAVVTPPYDVISPEARAQFAARSAANAVHLILPAEDPASPGLSRYAVAARTLAAWRAEGILRQDPVPAFYVYVQEFEARGARRIRRGVLALLRLEPYEAGVVFPHEHTFPHHKADRLELMRACRANLEAILGFYPGPAAPVVEALDRIMAAPAAAGLCDDDGVGHRLWPATDPADLAALVAALAGRPVFIADGHHRYETALRLREEWRAAGRGSAADHVLIHLVHAEDPGLVVLPTHRLLRERPRLTGPALRQALARHFRLEAVPAAPEAVAAAVPVLLARLADRGERGFVLYDGGGELLLATLTDATVPAALRAAGHHAAVSELDVTILHALILEEILGVPAAGEGEGVIGYTRDEAEAVAAVHTGGAALALFLNPPRVAQVQTVASAGGRMPQKSTFFYPKVPSGLVIRPLETGAPV